jgi:hypothetical protein
VGERERPSFNKGWTVAGDSVNDSDFVKFFGSKKLGGRWSAFPIAEKIGICNEGDRRDPE